MAYVMIGLTMLLGCAAAVAVARLGQSLLHIELVHHGREAADAAPFARRYLVQGVLALLATAALLALVLALHGWTSGMSAAEGFVLPSASLAGAFAGVALLPDGHARDDAARRRWPHAGRPAIVLFCLAVVAVCVGPVAVAGLRLPDPVFGADDLPKLLFALTALDVAVILAVRRASIEIVPGLTDQAADRFRRHTSDAMLFVAAGLELAMLAGVLAWSSPASIFGLRTAPDLVSSTAETAVTVGAYAATGVAALCLVLAVGSGLALTRLYRGAVRARSAGPRPAAAA